MAVGSTRVIPGLNSEESEAKLLGVSVRTLRRWRKLGYGPATTWIGRFPYYTQAAHERFLAAQERTVELPAPRQRQRHRAA